MTVELRNAQRDEFCRVLSMVASDAPTLCSGQATFDLAAHTWIPNHELFAWAGMLLPPFSWLTDREIWRTEERFSYAGLVEEIRAGPASFVCIPTDPREDHRHSLGEHFIHTEDVHRPNRLLKQEISPDLTEALWWRLKTASWQLHPFVSWGFRTPQGGHGGIGHGPVTKQVTGEPDELPIWMYRRTEAARAETAKF